MTMRRGTLYPVAEITTRRNPRARITGEFRQPLKGEWYISGAIPEAYEAFSDLGQAFYIATIVSGVRR